MRAADDPTHGGRSPEAEPGPIQLTWLNVRGVRSKDELLVRKADEQQWPLVLLTETKLQREQEKLYRGEHNEWSWILGSGQPPSRGRAPAKGGVGALIHSSIRGAVQKLECTREQLWLRLDDDRQQPLYIGVVYLPSGSHPAAKAEGTRIYAELGARIQKYQCLGTVLLGGDMNARIAANGDGVSNQAGLQLSRFSQQHGLLIANTQLPPTDSDARCQGAFSRVELRSGGLQRSTVDYVLVSKRAQANVRSLTLVEGVAHRVLSDHKPLVLKWQWQPAARARLQLDGQARVRWCVEDICANPRVQALMQAEMTTAMTAWSNEAQAWMASEGYRAISAEEKVRALLASWEYQVTRTLAATVGAKLIQQHSKSWIKGGSLMELIQERNKLRQQCEHTAKPNAEAGPGDASDEAERASWQLLVAQALHAQRAVRKEIHRRKRSEREQTFEAVEQEWSHPKLFYHRVHQMRSSGHGSTSAPLLRSKAGEVVSDLPSRLEVTRQHYADLGTDERRGVQRTAVGPAGVAPSAQAVEECIEAEEEFDERFARATEARVRAMAIESLAQAPTPLDQPWTALEYAAALKKLRNGKAPGPDSIHAEFLRYGGPGLHRATRILFNEILEQEVWPERWALGLICPIYKRAGDEAELDNYRPITLLSIVSKLFELLLNIRLTDWSEANRVLCDEQGGFRTRRGCADQLFVLKEVWSSRRERQLPTYAAFLDVKSAYDRVWRPGLWHQLYELGVRGKAWRMMRAMYERMRRVALVDGQRTAEFPVEVGVSQGSVLSPFLYSVFIDGLIRRLKSDPSLGVQIAGEQLVGLLYADDIVLLAPDPAVLQRMLDVTSQYAHQWRFHFNGRKSQIVGQGSEQQLAAARLVQWKLGGHELAVVPEYKYLGMECGLRPDRGPHNSFSTRLVHAATHRAHDLLLAGCEMDELDARCSSRLWKTLCRPILEYGSEVWKPNQGQSKETEQVQGWFARRVLGCSPSTPAVFATSELGLRSLESRREEYHLRYWRRLCSALPERLLHRVFRQRVLDVKAAPELTRHSLCHMLHATLSKYDLEEQWELVGTDQVYEPVEWQGLVIDRVREHEETMRQVTLASKSSLETYQRALLPPLGTMAPYLLRSRNREGAWIRCRLRSDTLPLMQVLARHCRPQRSDAESSCSLCSATQGPQVESAAHFLAHCEAPQLRQLRRDLCARLRQAVQQWHTAQHDKLLADWSGLPPLLAAGAAAVRLAEADLTTGLASITATLQAMAELIEPAPNGSPPAAIEANATTELAAPAATPAQAAPTPEAAAATRQQWCELLLGRCAEPISGRAWDASLLRATQRPIHNFLLLAWRTRAQLLGGVPTLLPAGRGIAIAPYQRMKSIGLRPTKLPAAASNLSTLASAATLLAARHDSSHLELPELGD